MIRCKKETLVNGDSGILHIMDLYGLSTDTKPTDSIATGSVFKEVDTGNEYLFDEDSATWINPSAEE